MIGQHNARPAQIPAPDQPAVPYGQYPPAPAPVPTAAPAPSTTTAANTYANPSLGIAFNYPAAFQPYLRDKEYLAGLPSRYTINKDPQAPLYSNAQFVIGLGGINGEISIDQWARNDANHKLKPFGDNPSITVLKIGGQEARLIQPSSDAPTKSAELIVQLKQPSPASGGQWTLLMINTDFTGVDLIKGIAASLRFL